MKKILLIIIFNSLFTQSGFSEKRNNIYINIYYTTSDCINCNIGLNVLRDFQTPINLKIIVPERDGSFIADYFRYNDLGFLIPYLHVSDKLFKRNPFDNRSATELFYNSNRLFAHTLSELPNDIELIKCLDWNVGDKAKIFQIKEVISNQLFCESNSGTYAVIDYLFNNLYLCLPTTDTLISISAKQFRPRQILASFNLDTTIHFKYRKFLKAYQKSDVRFEKVYLDKKSLFAFVSVPDFIPEGKDTSLINRPFILKFDINNLNNVSYYMVDFILDNGYELDNTDAFLINDSVLIASVFPETQSSESKSLGKWIVTKQNVFKWEGFLPYQIPSFFIESKKELGFQSKTIRNKWIYYNLYPYFINLQTGISYELKDASIVKYAKRKSSKFFILDLFEVSDKLHLLFLSINNKYYICYVNPKEKRLILKKEIVFEPGLVAPKFMNQNKLVALNKKEKQIVIIKFK